MVEKDFENLTVLHSCAGVFLDGKALLVDPTYDNSMFSRSGDKRWVIYERFKKPCLIDTRNPGETASGAARGKLNCARLGCGVS